MDRSPDMPMRLEGSLDRCELRGSLLGTWCLVAAREAINRDTVLPVDCDRESGSADKRRLLFGAELFNHFVVGNLFLQTGIRARKVYERNLRAGVARLRDNNRGALVA